MTKQEAEAHRRRTFDLCRELDELVTQSATWTPDDKAKAKQVQRQIWVRISENQAIYPGLTASLDAKGNLTRSISLFE